MVFLEQPDSRMPWRRLEECIVPQDPKAGRGCRPYYLSGMLRIDLVRVCCNLSGPALEDVL